MTHAKGMGQRMHALAHACEFGIGSPGAALWAGKDLGRTQAGHMGRTHSEGHVGRAHMEVRSRSDLQVFLAQAGEDATAGGPDR